MMTKQKPNVYSYRNNTNRTNIFSARFYSHTAYEGCLLSLFFIIFFLLVVFRYEVFQSIGINNGFAITVILVVLAILSLFLVLLMNQRWIKVEICDGKPVITLKSLLSRFECQSPVLIKSEVVFVTNRQRYEGKYFQLIIGANLGNPFVFMESIRETKQLNNLLEKYEISECNTPNILYSIHGRYPGFVNDLYNTLIELDSDHIRDVTKFRTPEETSTNSAYDPFLE